jgi:hypothetical protein
VCLLMPSCGGTAQRATDHLSEEDFARGRPRQEYGSGHRKIDTLSEHFNIDQNVEATLRIPVTLKGVTVIDRIVVLGIGTPTGHVRCLDTLRQPCTERVREEACTFDVGREDKGLAVPLAILQILLHDNQIAMFVAAETSAHVGRELVKVSKVLEVIRRHVQLRIDSSRDSGQHGTREQLPCDECARSHLIQRPTAEQPRELRSLVLLRARGRSCQSEQTMGCGGLQNADRVAITLCRGVVSFIDDDEDARILEKLLTIF